MSMVLNRINVGTPCGSFEEKASAETDVLSESIQKYEYAIAYYTANNVVSIDYLESFKRSKSLCEKLVLAFEVSDLIYAETVKAKKLRGRSAQTAEFQRINSKRMSNLEEIYGIRAALKAEKLFRSQIKKPH